MAKRLSYSWQRQVGDALFCFGLHNCNKTTLLELGPFNISWYWGKW